MLETAEKNKRKNSSLSLGLIALNIILAVIFSITGTETDESNTVALLYLIFSATILLGLYSLTYHGKGYRWAKWLFGVLLIISLGFIGLLWYAAGLAAAFKN